MLFARQFHRKINAYFKLSELAHIYADPLQKSTQWQREQAAALCNVEVPAEWKEAAKSVAEIQFSSAGYIYSCSATLLNTANNTGTPYLLTANHCVNRQSEADSLQTIWFKDSPTSTGQYGTSNAELVATGLAGDFTLLKLRGALPAGVRFSGWTAEQPAPETLVTGIHHPQDSYKRIAFGKTIASTCPPELLQEACDSFQSVRWAQGITEPGSSGSGLLVGAASDPKLTGTLTGGSSACTNPQGEDVYGQLSAYFPAIEYYLTGKGCAYKIGSPEQFVGFSAAEATFDLTVSGTGTCGWSAKA